MTNEYGWEFLPQRRAEIRANPIQGEFFTPQEAPSKLIRESTQNALDASAGDSPARVRISLSGNAGALPVSVARTYLKGLQPHLAADEIQLAQNAMGPLQFAVIEDFGTRGLRGAPEQARDTDPDNDFYWFWRNVGRSEKRGTQRGRWGVGKWVFPEASTVNAFFGLTIREDDARPLLMGQSVLKVHDVGGEQYVPYGFFAMFDDEDGFQMPIDDPEFVDAFKHDFGIQRSTEPGLSVVILHSSVELTLDSLIKAAIVNYFYAILSGNLVMEFDANGSTVLLDSATLRAEADELDWGVEADQIQADLNFAEWSVSSVPVATLGRPEGNPARVREDQVPEDMLQRLRESFAKGTRLTIRLPLNVIPLDGDESLSYFDVHIERDASLQAGRDYYIRNGISVTDQARHPRNVRAIVVIEDRPLVELLGDAEGPAHTRWDSKESALHERYRYGPSKVRYVANSVDALASILTGPSQGRDKELLADLFSVELPTGGLGPPGGNGKQRVPRPPSRPGPFRVTRTSSGFSVKPNPDSDDEPESVRIQVAYATRRGSPFAAYSPLDFDLASPDILIDADGVQIRVREENRVECTIQREDFRIDVDGFDENRDLRIQVT